MCVNKNLQIVGIVMNKALRFRGSPASGAAWYKAKKASFQITAVILIMVLIAGFLPGKAGAAYVGEKEITSMGACVIDYDTGIQLYGYEENRQRVPASMTKMLTAYLIYDAITAGEIKFDTKVKISAGVSEFSRNKEYSNVALIKDEYVTIDSLLDIVIIISACAAAIALAEGLCGTEAAFVKRMNEKMTKLGIDATFYDAFGGSPDNKISPYGMAVLARNLIKDHPEILKKSQQKSCTFRDLKYNTTNPLLGSYPGLDGLKTGYTDPALYCFTATAVKNGRRIISVTMGSSSGKTRGTDSEILLDYGFAVADKVIAEQQGGSKEGEDASQETKPGIEFPENMAQQDAVVLTSLFMDIYCRQILSCAAYLRSGAEGGGGVIWYTAYMTGSFALYGALMAEVANGAGE